MLPDTTGRFGLIQVLDAYFTGTPPMTTNEIASEAPIYDSVWGAFQEPAWRGSSSNVILSYYDTMPEDNKLISAHDLTWWQANHPDWIMYACDSNGNPTRDLAWDGTNFGNVPLAFWLPEVQAYQMQLLVPYMLSNGYNALAVDQSGLHNIIVGGNPNFGQTPNNSEYGCGTYDSSGTFHQRYGTPGTAYNRKDPQYQSDVLAWLSSSVSTLHAQNLKLIANHAVITTPSDPGEAQFIADIDGMLNEYGYTHDGQYLNGPNFSLLLSWDEALQASGKAMLVSDYLCMGSPSCSNDPATISAEQADFALSSYAIGNEGGEDLYLSPHGGSVYSYRPELSTRYGASCGPYQQVSSYVYVRRFQNGLAIVNTSTSTYTYTLPAHTYTDIENRSFSNPISVAPEDGYMLLTSGNGCS